MKKNNFIKGSISIFLIITFVANYLLAALLVDATRVHAAKTEIQAAAETATQNILTKYDECLYELYGLFAVTDMSEASIQKCVTEYIDQMVCLGIGEDSSLSKVMAQSVLFDAGVDEAWRPYELDLEVTAGSSVNLSQNAVLKSQIIDQMKFRAPVQIADSFLDFLNTVSELDEVKEAVEEKKEISEKLQKYVDRLEEVKTDAKDTKSRIVNFCVSPTTALSTSKRTAKKASTLVSNMKQLDQALGRIAATSKNSMEKSIDDVHMDFVQRMKKINTNASELYSKTDRVISELEKVKSDIRKLIDNQLKPKRDEVANDSGLSAETRKAMKQAYQSDIDNAEEYIKEIDGYTGPLENVLPPLNKLDDYEFSDWNKDNAAVQSYHEMEDLLRSIKFEGSQNGYRLDDVVTEEEFSVEHTFYQDGKYTFVAGYFGYVNGRLQDALNAINKLNIKTSEKKDVQEEVKQEKANFIDSDRLQDIPKEAKYEAQTIKALKEYNKKNASGEMDKILSKLTGALSTLGTDIRDNLYINEYAMTYFRSYVHHLKMANDKTIGKDGYDKVISDRYCQEQYINLETTVAELEYILIGSNSTALNLAGVYAEIMVWRLALNLLSVFMTAEIYQGIVSIASFAGPFSPLVVLGLVLVTAATQAALDTQAIMDGKEVYVIRTQANEWGISTNGSISTNGGSQSADVSTKLKAGYSDYVRLMLLMMKQDTKLARMGTVITMNMQKINDGFTMQNAFCNVYADVSADMDFLLLSPKILPTQLSQSGKYSFGIGVNSAY